MKEVGGSRTYKGILTSTHYHHHPSNIALSSLKLDAGHFPSDLLVPMYTDIHYTMPASSALKNSRSRPAQLGGQRCPAAISLPATALCPPTAVKHTRTNRLPVSPTWSDVCLPHPGHSSQASSRQDDLRRSIYTGNDVY